MGDTSGAEYAAPTGRGNGVARVAAKISLLTELRTGAEMKVEALGKINFSQFSNMIQYANGMKCFIASAFDHADVDAIFNKAITPVLGELKIKKLRVDRVEHNDDIDDKIFSLIPIILDFQKTRVENGLNH